MKRPILEVLAAGVGATTVMVLGVVLTAATAPPAEPVFTAQQATAGKAAFAKTCAACHMPDLSGNNEAPALAGTLFMETWKNRTTKELFDYMSAEMPRGGTPQTQEIYLALTAFVLQSNGAVAGEQAYTATTAVPIDTITPSEE
jgi:mono/diheme cytochrome c family protein